MEHEVTAIPTVIGTLSSHQRIGINTEELGKKRTGGDHPNYTIIEIGLNTEKSPGDLKLQ